MQAGALGEDDMTRNRIRTIVVLSNLTSPLRRFFLVLLVLILPVVLACQSPCEEPVPCEGDDDRQTDGTGSCDGDKEHTDTDAEEEEAAELPDCAWEKVGMVLAGSEHTDCFGLTWVYLPAGSFNMGCHPDEFRCADRGYPPLPRHTRTVKGFWMLTTPVTQAEYYRVTQKTPWYFIECGDRCPVESVDWLQAHSFCEAVEGRLPSEAEWEYAARAGTDTIWICGNYRRCLGDIAWYRDNSKVNYPGCYQVDSRDVRPGTGDPPCIGPNPVSQKEVNPFGLYDMLGNVWEWVEDCWHYSYHGAPKTEEVWRGGECEYRVIRGGSFLTGTERYDERSYYPTPSIRWRSPYTGSSLYTEGIWDIGFRCARDLETQK